jgi:nucleotide-binding universal stress UspA family protein
MSKAPRHSKCRTFPRSCRARPIANTIGRLARQLGVDQIVIGSRGLGAIGRLVLSSVATKVAHLARVPVTLVK